jgi:hypothetical protein
MFQSTPPHGGRPPVSNTVPKKGKYPLAREPGREAAPPSRDAASACDKLLIYFHISTARTSPEIVVSFMFAQVRRRGSRRRTYMPVVRI